MELFSSRGSAGYERAITTENPGNRLSECKPSSSNNQGSLFLQNTDGGRLIRGIAVDDMGGYLTQAVSMTEKRPYLADMSRSEDIVDPK
jgi:hypothetical protein